MLWGDGGRGEGILFVFILVVLYWLVFKWEYSIVSILLLLFDLSVFYLELFYCVVFRWWYSIGSYFLDWYLTVWYSIGWYVLVVWGLSFGFGLFVCFFVC